MPGEVPVSEVRAVWERAAAKYPRGALRLRFSDNHDQLRATGQFGLPAALAASALMFTLDGVPLLYNGMEVGDNTESAAPALFEKAPIDWGMAERRPQVTPYYRALAQLRRAHPAFTRGAVRWLGNGDEQRVLSFERAGAGESLVVVVNLSSQPYAGIVKTEPGQVPGHHPGVAQRCAASPGQAERSGRPGFAGRGARPVGIQGFQPGAAVNTYASDCQGPAAANILAHKGIAHRSSGLLANAAGCASTENS